ncbi:class I SAM-dependent methyltransferase [Microbacterium ulmi]|uniref:Methyltransferase domain-containing protein n=1 Tax=Microbacterium ulmi TaxID=179095 RepID=A0A7Y2M1X1_9MICO|nr:methyltransferase domain-containing protein [Microbacterium ulmi]NII68770.1 SAM-dependent methyltransferase [Microbacterium ulmi]NNH03573.1 methyltransferase domain-containing protein [Microbacterium ulmi]
MSFDGVAAESYDRFMGRYSAPLAVLFADWVGISPGDRVLDVGCGPGALTCVLVQRAGAASVAAVDPAEAFVAAVRTRLSGIDARQAYAEALPFPDDAFDATLAELVVHFMTDAAAGVAEMARVTRRGGVVAACVWDFEHDRAPHSPFLRAVREVKGEASAARRAGTRGGDLTRLLTGAGCVDVDETALTVSVDYRGFDEWWSVHTLGIGSSAQQLDGLDANDVERVRVRAREIVGDGTLTVPGTAWAARGRV